MSLQTATVPISGSITAGLIDGAVSNASGEIVNCTAATLTVTKALHNGRTITLNRATGIAVTLPLSAGDGSVYNFYVGTTFSGNATIKVPTAADSYTGFAIAPDTDSAGTGKFWTAAASDDTVTLTGTTTGGKAGDVLQFKDVASGIWSVTSLLKQSGGSEATPFSATVS